MKKIFLSIITCAGLLSSAYAQSWGYYASAVFVGIGNNAPEFYDVTTTGNGAQNISGNPSGHYYTSINSDASLNGPIYLEGAEIKTYKNGSANVCQPILHYTVYQGARPASPVFTAATLNFFGNCTSGAFPTGGPCNVGDQKWQVTGLHANLTGSVGSYNIEFYFEIPGSTSGGGCGTVLTDPASGSYATSVAVSTLLPVTLTSFSAQASGNKAQLTWKTAQELNCNYFDVQRSANGKDFTSVAHVAATNKATGAAYSFTDTKPISGKSYYRLNTVDKDGKSALSDIRDVEVTTSDITVAPNPASNYVNIKGAAVGSTVSFVNVDGKILKTATVQSANHRLYFNLPANIYFVKVTSGSKTNVFKVVVKN